MRRLTNVRLFACTRALLTLACGLVLGAPVMTVPARAADVYGLIVGINDYLGDRNDLDGAVNDANDISDALDKVGAKEILRFYDQAAVKADIETAWNRLVGEARAGDTIIFTYAGHGGQEPEPPGRHDEADGMNENFLLAKFAVDGDGTRERIVDDEINEWLKRADDKGIKVVFVADSCHSGTMNRSIEPTGIKFRRGNFGTIKNDRLTTSAAAAKLDEDDFKNVTFVGATSEDKLTPEVEIDGKERGALSWAFARAVEGGADANGDGQISQLELLRFVVPAVHAKVESQQTPQVSPLKARDFELFPVPGAKSQATEVVKPKPKADDADVQLRVAVDGDATLPDLPFMTRADKPADADLVWRVAKGTVEHTIGGEVAENIGPDRIAQVLTKWIALKWLQHFAALDPISVSLPKGNHRYRKDEVIDVAIAGASLPHLTLFNLPPDGRVEFFIPDPNRPGEAEKDWRGETMKESFRVDKPPFGAEHLVALFTPKVLSDLHAVLAAMNSAGKAGQLPGVLRQVLEGTPFQVGVVDIYTGADE